MILGVPTLNRYDLLGKLIASAEAGRLKPTAYLIVDNGGRFREEAPRMAGVGAALERGVEVHLLVPGKNLGVAASWNAILDYTDDERVAIANDDVELGEDALKNMDRALDGLHYFVIADGGPNANGWCLFAQTSKCTALVGPYDENFFPAYYEDSDYERRLNLAGIVPHYVPATFRHEGWATMRRDQSIATGQEESAEFFRQKWGGSPGDPGLYSQPFAGLIGLPLRKNPEQSNWVMYHQESEPITIMRWDVINYIAKKIGTMSYVEIGVANGENMRRVNIEYKIGVDPSPTVEGVKAASVFYPCPSDYFFEHALVPWDIVFIDGLHYADQAYRDIMNAARYAKVVIVHDANPHTEELQRVPYSGGDWTGDVWKAIARIRAEGQHLVRTVDTDFGVSVIIPNRQDDSVYFSMSDDGKQRDLPRETWTDLQEFRRELLGLIPVSEWKAWFEKAIQCV